MDGGKKSHHLDDVWLAPTLCAVCLTVGVLAGIVRACGKITSCEIALLCSQRRSRVMMNISLVAVTAAGALLAGFAGLLVAVSEFIAGRYKPVPRYLACFTLCAYVLLLASLVITAIGMQYKHQPDVYQTLRRTAQCALLGGLAAGLGIWVLCDQFEDEELVPKEWREGCMMLGESSGLLLLGLVAAQIGPAAPPHQWGSPGPSMNFQAYDDLERSRSNGYEAPSRWFSSLWSPSQQSSRSGTGDLAVGASSDPLLSSPFPCFASKEHGGAAASPEARPVGLSSSAACFEARHNRTHSNGIFGRAPVV